MEEQTWFSFFFLSSFFSLILLFFFLPKLIQTQKSKKKLPPSPPSYPIIGHLHLLKEPVHRTLENLSHKYGPIFGLKFGSSPVLLVSSPELLEECFTKNDVIFANRPQFLLGKHIGYNDTAMAFASHGPHWRNLRRVTTLKFFSNSRLNEYMALRREETVSLVKNLFNVTRSGKRSVEMKSRLLELTFNIVMRMATGKRYFGADVEDSEEAERFRGIIADIFDVTGTSNPNDFLKFLQWIDFQGFEKKMVSLQKRTDEFLQFLVDEIRNQRSAYLKDDSRGQRKESTEEKNSQTLVDEMLALQEVEPGYYSDELIKGNISVVLLAGTDTSSSTVEWAMSLLLNHPDVLEKARAEIDINIGHDRLVEESDISKLPYIQCIMNETLRMQPVSPLIAPHVASEDCVIGGYHIPRGTMLLPNAWALHRDPNIWEDPTSFKPERFKGAQIEGNKLGFIFVPFGMGRRQCPGAGLANRVVNRTLAALIQCFDWERVSEELVDLTEGKGITMPKRDPLEAMCKPREKMINVLLKL